MELEDLQYRLGEIDLLTRPSRSGGKNLIEFLVVELEGIAIKIRMDGDRNHARPHIHIDYGKKRHAASYAIDNGERLSTVDDDDAIYKPENSDGQRSGSESRLRCDLDRHGIVIVSASARRRTTPKP
ncbi:MAG TPA: hypothetical protein VIJ35_22745 [Bradyrhizobium sp.]